VDLVWKLTDFAVVLNLNKGKTLYRPTDVAYSDIVRVKR